MEIVHQICTMEKLTYSFSVQANIYYINILPIYAQGGLTLTDPKD